MTTRTEQPEDTSGTAPAQPAPTEGSGAKDVFFFIPHTHWEGAVFKTREQYLEMGLPNILRALRLLRAYPGYRFVLDQACYVEPFLERYPQEEAAFRQFIREGRLAIVGGTDTMLDVNMPGGESFVRQVLYGKGYFRHRLGVDVTVGWQLDTFGHHAQMPQLLRLAGYRSFWFFRGVSNWSVPSEFFWEGIDGSQIPAYWLPQGYAVTYGSPRSLPEFTAFMKGRYDLLAPQSRGPGRVGLAGADVCAPEEHVPALVEQFNAQPDAPFQLRLAVPADFEEAVDRRPDRPVVRGEMNPIFQGAYSSRIELKQHTREIERLLTAAEKLGVLLRWLGDEIDDGILWRAWEPALFNQAHDLMSGVMTDHVYEDTIRGYDFARRIAGEEVCSRLQSLAARIDTRGEGIPLVIFNTLGWARTDVVEADIGFASREARALQVTDPDGQPVPVQILQSERLDDGGLLRARVAFVARSVPALGFSVYRVVPLKEAGDAGDIPGALPGATLENEHYRIDFDADGGAMTSLTVKNGGWSALSGPGNVVVREEDHGDLWEPYRPLDGGSRIAMKDRHPAPPPGIALYSSEQSGQPGAIRRGPVVSEFTVAHPYGEKGHFRTTVRLYAGLRRIDIRTQILNNDPFVRYRVLFPTPIRAERYFHEIPFGALERPDGIEFPAQHWIECGDGEKGLALLNRGLPGNAIADGTLMLSLLRTTRIVAYGFGGGYEPGMTSDTGFELGRELTFDYALAPHAGDWRQAGIHRDGWEFNHPLMAVTASSHAGVLPGRWGFADIDHAGIVVSALKGGPDETAILRVYEATGQPANHVTIRLSAHVKTAEEVNLMEDPGRKLDVQENAVRLNLRPYEIKTLKLALARG